MPSTRFNSDVRLSKGILTGCVLRESQELEQAYRLRYRVFVEDLKWVTGKNGLDIDEYDDGALILGVLEGNRVCGTVRIVLPDRLFMVEKDFKDLIHNHDILKNDDTIEVSRLAVDPDMRSRRHRRTTAFLLYYLVYLWMCRNHKRYLYLVSTHKLFHSLKWHRGAHVETLGKEGVTRDNVTYQVGLIDMSKIMDEKHMLLYEDQYRSI